MRAGELGESVSSDSPAQDIEFVLSHADNLEASGFVQHLKLPHYVDFQSELVLVRDLRNDWDKANQGAATDSSNSSNSLDSSEPELTDESSAHSDQSFEVVPV